MTTAKSTPPATDTPEGELVTYKTPCRLRVHRIGKRYEDDSVDLYHLRTGKLVVGKCPYSRTLREGYYTPGIPEGFDINSDQD